MTTHEHAVALAWITENLGPLYPDASWPYSLAELIIAERARAHAEGKAEGRAERDELLTALDALCAAVRKAQYRLDRATFNSVVLPVLKAAEGCDARIRALAPHLPAGEERPAAEEVKDE